MDFKNIDFAALRHLAANLTDEQIQQAAQMAEHVMNQKAEEEESKDFREGLRLGEEYDNLPGSVLDALEAAWDLQDFYDGQEADYSATVLFLAKSLLFELRASVHPLLMNLIGFEVPKAYTQLQDYAGALTDSNIQKLAEAAQQSQWEGVRQLIHTAMSAQYRAQSDCVTLEQVQALETVLIPGLLELEALA
jgi:hypothetical protein